MKIAFVHDYLPQYGGGEKVLECLAEIFPDAPIYTLLYSENLTQGRFRQKKIFTSFLDFSFAKNHHRLFIPLMPWAAGSLNLGDKYDLIISVSASFAKGVRYSEKTKHICYCLSPLRYAWEPNFINSKLLPSPSPKNIPTFLRMLECFLLNLILAPLIYYLRNWDYRVAQRPNKIVAISDFIAGKIKKYYGREATVIYPPLGTDKFYFDSSIKTGDYYIAAGRLIHYKNFHVIIEAFNRLKIPLKVAGKGPELKNLKKRADSAFVQFLEFVSDDELRKLYSSAKALVFASEEDFGLVMAEAQACGTPVIALKSGGALEIVREPETGIFFEKPTPEDLVKAIKKFETMKFDHKFISDTSLRFSKDNFKIAFKKLVESSCPNFKSGPTTFQHS